MHVKSQYVDGKLIDEKGQFVDDKPKLHPPPPSTVEEVKIVKRKNISISLKTWEAWKRIKGTKKWDTIFDEALVLFNKVKNLEDIITQIALQKPTFVQGGNNNHNNSGISTRTPRAKFRLTPAANIKKLPFLDEIKEIVLKLEKGEKGIRSILTPLEDIDLEAIQLEDDVLEEKMMEAQKRSNELNERKNA